MTLANDVKAKLAFQPDDAEPLAKQLQELVDGYVAYRRITEPVRLSGENESKAKLTDAFEALWIDYLANGITEGMATRALLTVTKCS